MMRNAIRAGCAMALHAVPLRSGLTRVAFNPLMNRLMADAGPTIEARLHDGTAIEVSPDDYHGRILYLFGTNDPKVSHAVNALLREGDVFLDIGANYSTIGLAAAPRVGDSGAVYLFEPQQQLCERVARTIAEGPYGNVHLHRYGLFDRDAVLTLQSPAAHSGMATFVEREEEKDQFVRSEQCEVREIERALRPLVGDRPFGAKLDIEGAEMFVLPWLVAQPNFRFVVFEAAHDHRALYDTVIGAGLAVYGLCRDAFRCRAERIDSYEEMLGFHDLVALRQERHAGPGPLKLHLLKAAMPA